MSAKYGRSAAVPCRGKPGGACDDVQTTSQAMAARGVRFTQEPRPMSWGVFAIFQDPNGTWFGLRQPEP